MRILILGASGLIGHTLLRELSISFDVFGTIHKSKEEYDTYFFDKYQILSEVDIKNTDILKGIIKAIKPNFILNCVGITRRKIDAYNILDAVDINACFPHRLAKLSEELNFKVIHFSTDCVFDGKIGNYTESDLTTAEDIYGRTKALGEISTYNNCLTLRSSFIGQELFGKTELLDWFLSQEGCSIKGYRKTLYSGVSTIFMTKVIKDIIINHSNLNGLYQLASEQPISKYDLLHIAKEIFDVNVEIIPDDGYVHTPTLDASKLRKTIGICVPDWYNMMNELANHKNEYK